MGGPPRPRGVAAAAARPLGAARVAPRGRRHARLRWIKRPEPPRHYREPTKRRGSAMTVKQLLFREEARERIRRGIDELADAVKVTLGPRGRTVIIDSEFGPPQIVNSGVIVARSIELEDRFENMGAQLLREVAARTSEMARSEEHTSE